MTINEFKNLLSTLKMEVDLFLSQWDYDPLRWVFNDFCWEIAEYYRPKKNTRPVFTSMLAEFAIQYGKERIASEMAG